MNNCPSGCPFEAFILSGMQELRDGLKELRDGQTSMRDGLHAAVLDNTTKLTVLDTRVDGVETGMKSLKHEVRKEARRWGAIGGAATSAAALVLGLLKAVFMPGHGA